MTRETLQAALEGGYIEQLTFDAYSNALSMSIEVLDNGVLALHSLQFEKLGQISYKANPSWAGPTRRLQLTELTVESAPEHSSTEEWHIAINIWDNTFLEVHCSVIRVDGVVLR